MIKKVSSLALLDTHIWIWLINNDQRIRSDKFIKKIQEFEDKKGLRVSVISIWEIGILHAKGRIRFPFSVHQWIQKALDPPGMLLAELTPEIALESAHLPGTFHGDPADRIIVTTAQSLGATLVTVDQRILKYAKEHHLEVLSIP